MDAPTNRPPAPSSRLWLVWLAITSIAFIAGRCWFKPAPAPPGLVPPPDTVVVHRYYRDTVRITVATPPRRVVVYLPDTARRKRIESGSILAGVELQPGRLQIETIDPRGVPFVATYPLPERPALLIAADGSTQVQALPPPPKPRRLAWLATGAAIGGTAVLFILR